MRPRYAVMIRKVLAVASYTINPLAGFTIAVRVDVLVINNPLLVAFISNPYILCMGDLNK
jgi:hypothetical protein